MAETPARISRVLTVVSIQAAPPRAAPLPSPRASNQEIAGALLSQFDKSDVIALGEWHGSQEDSDLRLQLIRHEQFPEEVRCVVVECANSRYQPVLDRYIAGEDIAKPELQPVWRDVTTPGACDSPVYEQLLAEIHTVDVSRTSTLKLRVLAADPPIDWAHLQGPEQWRKIAAGRDAFAAELITREVLHKRQKALVIVGAGHLWRNQRLPGPNLAALLERDFPGRLYSVVRLSGIYPDTAKLEQLIRAAGRPPLLPLNGTAFGSFDANEFLGHDIPIRLFPDGLAIGDVIDACIYGGRIADTTVGAAASVVSDRKYTAEKQRRILLTRPAAVSRPTM